MLALVLTSDPVSLVLVRNVSQQCVLFGCPLSSAICCISCYIQKPYSNHYLTNLHDGFHTAFVSSESHPWARLSSLYLLDMKCEPL